MTAYEEIQQIIGMDEFKQLADRLKQVAENRKRLHGVEISLPNYIFITDPGCGITTHLEQLTRFLKENSLFRFAGEQPFFEWMLKKSDSAWDIEHLIDRINVMAGFHNKFMGVIGLELDVWSESEVKGGAFQRLLDLIDSKKDLVLFVLILPAKSDDSPEEMINAIRSTSPVEIIHFHTPTSEQLAEYLKNFVNRKGFSVSNQAYRELPAILDRLRNSPGFDGLSTISNLADEIIYHNCSSGRVNEATILKDDLDFITREGGYLSRLAKKKDVRRIGFGG